MADRPTLVVLREQLGACKLITQNERPKYRSKNRKIILTGCVDRNAGMMKGLYWWNLTPASFVCAAAVSIPIAASTARSQIPRTLQYDVR